MKEVFITGHKNPDMDSICAAYGYAELKKKIDSEHEYKAVRCGHLTESVKKHFESLGLTPPPYMRDVHPKISDVMRTTNDTIQIHEPIYTLVKAYSEKDSSVFPVFEGTQFKGLLSVDDITGWFLKDNSDEKPIYRFTAENIAKVISAKIIKKGSTESFSASLIAGAASLEEFCYYLNKDSNSIVVMGNRKDHIKQVMKMQIPALVVSTDDLDSDTDFSSFNGWVFATSFGTAEALRRLRMAPEISTIMGIQGMPLQTTDFFDDGKQRLTDSQLRGLAVFNGEEYAGFVTRRCFLDKPSYNVILVDHNEQNQSIKGIETATVREILDHHRLDALKTNQPIFIDAEPLGSTCTIVYQQFVRNNIVPDKDTAKVLLSGIIADTIILKSPTTTSIDRISAGALAAIAGIYDILSFGQEMFSRTQNLASTNPDTAINSDFKIYSEKGMKFGIGQCETTNIRDIDSYCTIYLEALSRIKSSSSLDIAMVMITDVIREKSILLSTEHRCLAKLPYTKLSAGMFDMPGIMSRKKQLLPEVIHTIE